MLLTFHIQLANITDPAIWRKITVPAGFTFSGFHYAIQAAFGWQNSHLYRFSKTGSYSEASIGIRWEEDEDKYEVKDSEKVKLSEVFKRKGQKYVYIYDFGDSWEHHILLEKTEKKEEKKAFCLAGEGACPPEDCGGPWGYDDLKKTLEDPKNPEYKDTRAWLGLKRGAKWDASAFNLDEAKRNIEQITQ